MEFTKQQLEAVESRGKNLLVAAAAGSGKTAVLVERIIQLILSGNFDVDKMLIVTFTNAAANEMRLRIHKAIAEKISAAVDTDLVESLERQAILLSGASIMTFHAFCLSVLRRHFAKIKLDPKFREADEHELNIIKQEVIEEMLERNYARKNAAFMKFTDDFGGSVQGDSDLQEMIIKLHKFSQSRPYPTKWLISLVKLYKNPENFKVDEKISWLDFVQNFAMRQAGSVIEFARAECLDAKRISENLKPQVGLKNFEDDLRIINGIAGALGDWDKLSERLRGANFTDFDKSRKFSDDVKAVKETLNRRRNNYRKKIENLRDKIVAVPTADIVEEMKSLAESVRQLVKITIKFNLAFAAAKRERNIIDFDDMEHLALKIFNTDKNTAAAYREKFQVILVDEYQDTNGVQEEIISKVVGAANFFAVGDVKQSIYRFRNADPEIFLQKYHAYPALDDCERIDLSTNFRSRRTVVDAVNAIFKPLMIRDATEIDYDEDAKLNCGAKYPAGAETFDEPAELYIINLETNVKTDYDEDAEDLQAMDKLEREIQLISNKINSMKDKRIFDVNIGAYRPLTFRDIVILLRSMDGTAAKIVDVLRRNGIPAYAADKDGYFKAPEIQTVLSLLKILDNARQDIPLATVLLSPIGGFSTEDLALLRIGERKGDLYTLISGDERYKNFLAKLNRWREMARQMSVPELLNTIYRETGYYDYFGRQLDGRIPQANLRMLIDRAAAYEKTAFRGLSRFVQFLKRIRDLGNDLSAARTLSENEDVVRVMTIHKSKGLEFPVVFVAQLGKQFNLQDLRENVIPHRSLGVGICKTLEGSGIRVKTFARQIIVRKARAEMLAEELRILYVAFTRAREKLILIGTANNGGDITKFDDNEGLTADTIQSVRRPLDWLLMIKNLIAAAVNVEIVDAGAIKIPAAETAAAIERKETVAVAKVERSPLEKIPAKISVTEIKRRLDAEDFEDELLNDDRPRIYRRPSFLQAAEISGVEFGTIMHSVMQHLNLNGNLSRAGIVAQIDSFVDKQILTAEQAAAAKPKAAAIANFFTTKIGKGIIAAKEIYRELPFNHFVGAENIEVGEMSKAVGERIFVQGIIDVLFKDAAGNWVLLDYKTDRNNTDEHFRREYRTQIEFYAGAVEAVAHLKVAEKYLYLLGAGRLIDMN